MQLPPILSLDAAFCALLRNVHSVLTVPATLGAALLHAPIERGTDTTIVTAVIDRRR